MCGHMDTSLSLMGCVCSWVIVAVHGGVWLVLLWLEPPLANDFCNFLNKIAIIMKIFVEVDLLNSYQPLCQR